MSEQTLDTYRQVDLLNESALKLSEAGEDQIALELLQKALELQPDHAPTHVVIGLVWQNLKKTSEAEKAFRRAVDLDPDYGEALKGLGLLLISNDQKSEGTEWLSKYLEKNKWKDYSNLELLVSTQHDLDKQEESTETLDAAWKMTDWNTTADSNVGLLYARHLRAVGQDDLASEVFERIAIQNQDHEIFSELASTLLNQRKYEDAIRAWECARDLVLENMPLYSEYNEEFDLESAYETINVYIYWIAYTYLDAGNGKKALEMIEAIADYSGWYDAAELNLMGRALMSLDRYEEAIDTFQKGIEKFGDDSDDWGRIFFSNLITACFKLKDHKESEAVLEEAITRFPQNGDFYIRLLINQIERGQFDSVMNTLDKAIKAEIPKSSRDIMISIYLNLFYFMDLDKDSLSIVEPYIKSNPDEFIFKLFNSIDSHLTGDTEKKNQAIDLFEHISALIPDYIGVLKRKIWLLIGQEIWSAAQEAIKDTLETELEASDRLELLNNLGYVHLLQSKWAEAEKVLQDVAAHEELSEYKPKFDWLEIAFYKDGEVIPDYCGTPKKRSVSPQLAARANLSTLALAQNDAEGATSLAIQVLSEAPDTTLGYELLGFISLARGEKGAAKEAWGQILKSEQESEEELPVIQPINELLANLDR
jgi:tetratricopeptide (TPR) repeat protein